uniref:STAM-binding protein n=1 Tax=Schizaphis graminum TaxID=13262 RepID=A0A2S2P2M8_SCHGA
MNKSNIIYNLMCTKVIEPPEVRIKTLMLLNPKTKLNPNIATRKYYQSGQEWISMGDVYAKENNLEQAYIYYTKFMTLFLQIIKKHPDYKNVSIEERNLNYRALREVFPKIENIKTKLLEQYRTQYELNQEQIALQKFKENHDKKY